MKNIENDFNLSFYRIKHQGGFQFFLRLVLSLKNSFGNCDKFTATDNVTCFVTWTDWDIGNQLIHELKRKKIGHPVALKSWIDLRSIARRQLPVTKYKHVPRLRKMFDIYDIQWEGNQHRGIDDARNTAKLIFQFRDSLRSIFKFSVAESKFSPMIK